MSGIHLSALKRGISVILFTAKTFQLQTRSINGRIKLHMHKVGAVCVTIRERRLPQQQLHSTSLTQQLALLLLWIQHMAADDAPIYLAFCDTHMITMPITSSELPHSNFCFECLIPRWSAIVWRRRRLIDDNALKGWKRSYECLLTAAVYRMVLSVTAQIVSVSSG